MNPDNVARVEEKARNFISHISRLTSLHSGLSGESAETESHNFIFSGQPTVLDAVATTLFVRLMDVGRENLLDETTKAYTLRMKDTEQWKRTTHGRRTVWDASIGKVAELNPL